MPGRIARPPTDSRGSISRHLPGCGRRESAQGCSPWRPQSTSSQSRVESIRSSCVFATSRTSTPSRASRSAAAALLPACATVPNVSAGVIARRRPLGTVVNRGGGCVFDYPARRRPSSARARAETDGSFVILAASDSGTGSRTALAQIAADELEVPTALVTVELGEHAIPGSTARWRVNGIASWGSAVVKACHELSKRLAPGRGYRSTSRSIPKQTRPPTTRSSLGTRLALSSRKSASISTRGRRAFRACSVFFAAGRIINAKTARSQFLGGMTMGLSMALHEEACSTPASGST